MNTSTSAWLSARGIRKSFAGIEILHGVDFDLQPGSVHALVGHNGAGKSTLIKVLAGMYPDHVGEVLVHGSPVRLGSPKDAAAAGISVIHQEFALVPGFTAAENIALGREPEGPRGVVRHTQIEDDAVALLESYGLSIPMGIPVGRLSVAHQQLTEIAKALGAGAQVLVMDEPTSRLAPAERGALFDIIRRLTADGVGVIYISHFLEEVLDIADDITVLRNGEVVETSPAAAFTLDRLAQQIIGDHQATHRGAHTSTVGTTEGLVLRGFGPADRPANDLVVRSGEIVGIAGLVGSGRTSLLSAVAGARPSHGAMEVFGTSATFTSPAQAVAAGVVLVPEDRKTAGLVMQQPLSENVVLSALGSRFSSRLGLVRAGAVTAAAQQAVERYRIVTKDISAPVSGLSGGNQQKVLLARAAETSPRVLLFDQPTAGVDIGAKAEIYDHIRALAASGVACVVTSDELEELLFLCDQVAVMRSGRLDAPVPTAGLDEHTLLAQMSVTTQEED